MNKLKLSYRFLLTAVFVLTSLFSFSQNLEKRITISMKNKSLEKVILKIEKLGDIQFSYNSKLNNLNKKINITAENQTMKQILDKILPENNIKYLVVENHIVLKESKKSPDDNKTRKFVLSGYMKDKKNGETIIGVNIFTDKAEYGTISNTYGFYSITLPEGEYTFNYSFIGYQNIQKKIDLNKDIEFSLDLDEINFDINEVEIIASDDDNYIESNQLSEMKFSPQVLSQLPGFVGDVDVIKSLNTIPGISSYGDGSTLFYVRGGNSDQNLILIDEAIIYNPTHLFGFFTALAPNSIKDVKAYKGDFPARYGGRLSSVIDIRSKDGNMKRLGFAGNLGLFTTNLSIEGPIVKDKSSFFISGRRSNLDWLNNFSGTDHTFDFGFYDIHTKLNFKFNNNNRLYFTLYKGNDDYSRFTKSSVNTYGISWDNTVGTLRWNHIFNNRLFSNTTLNFSQYNYFLHISREENNYWNSSIRNLTAKSDFTYYLNPKNTIRAGIEISNHYCNPGNIHFSDDEIQQSAPVIPRYYSNEYTFYMSNEQKLSKKFSVRYGLRLPIRQNIGPTTVYSFDSHYNVNGKEEIEKNVVYSSFVLPEPRMNIKYQINKRSALKASYNRCVQFLQLLTNSTSPFTSLEVWVPSGPNIEPQKLDQFALGYFHQVFKNDGFFSIESFYKKFYNQIDYADHPNMLYNPFIEGELRFGEAWAYGIEFLFRKTKGDFTGWIGYTYSRTFKKINDINNDKTFPSFYDRPHDLSISLSYKAGKQWVLSANWFFISGGAISTPTGFFENNGYIVPVYGEKNNDRLPDYQRLDISINFKFSKPEKRFQHSLLLTLYNALGNENPFAINFNKMMNSNEKFVVPFNFAKPYELVPSSLSVSGFIPSINYNFSF